MTNVITRARVEGLVIVAVALAYIWQAHQIPELYQMPGVPGPTVFPMLVGSVFALGGLWRIFAPSKSVDTEQPWSEDEGVTEEEKRASGGVGGWLKAHGRFCGLWVSILGYMLLMPIIGFPVATALALALMFWLMGEHRIGLVALVSVVTTIVLHVVFAMGLSVNLPTGVLAKFIH
jgi:hypothetical protein